MDAERTPWADRYPTIDKVHHEITEFGRSQTHDNISKRLDYELLIHSIREMSELHAAILTAMAHGKYTLAHIGKFLRSEMIGFDDVKPADISKAIKEIRDKHGHAFKGII